MNKECKFILRKSFLSIEITYLKGLKGMQTRYAELWKCLPDLIGKQPNKNIQFKATNTKL